MLRRHLEAGAAVGRGSPASDEWTVDGRGCWEEDHGDQHDWMQRSSRVELNPLELQPRVSGKAVAENWGTKDRKTRKCVRVPRARVSIRRHV